MARGGERLGKQGTSYSNRTDLNAQPVRVATGQTYGDAKAQRESQQQMPLAQVPTALPPGGGAPQGSGQTPGALGSLYAPTGRPDEPVTAGMAQGPGAGPSFGDLNDYDVLDALARKFPGLPGLHRMIQEMR